MIIEYDTRPDITVDAKLRSLIQSIQLAFNETDSISSRLSEIETALETINGQLTSLDERVTALEQQNG